MQPSRGSTLGPGEDWGNGARFAPGATALVTGDWNGDGLDDVTYQGVCGNGAEACWRVHLSHGDGFDEPANWGTPGPAPGTEVEAADLNGDGRDDLVYQSGCAEGTCWFAQYSSDNGFQPPARIGVSRSTESDWRRWFDYDGDGAADLVSRDPDGEALQVRSMSGPGLGSPRSVASLPGQVTDVALRRVDNQVQARATYRCEKARVCSDELRNWKGSLVTEVEYHRRVITSRLFDGHQRVA